MSDEQRVVTCQICGHKMVIPPGLEKAANKCAVCGVAVGDVMESPMDALKEAWERPAITTAMSKKPEPKVEIFPIVRDGLIFGLIGAAVGGTFMALLMTLLGGMGDKVTVKGLIASSDMGIAFGFMLCGSWAITKRLSRGLVPSIIITMIFSLTVNTLVYILEWVIIAKPDQPLWQMSIIFLVAGGAVGAVLGSTVASED